MAQNFSEDTMARIADIRLGCRVDRAAAAVTTGPVNFFHVTGGNVLLTGFYGEITVQQAVAQAISINMDVDVGTDTPIASVGADANNFVVGRMCYLPAVAGALTWTAQGGACPLTVGPPYVLRPGMIAVTSSGSQTTGRMKWSLWYVPIEDGAYVEAV